jgi:hypothetical protein
MRPRFLLAPLLIFCIGFTIAYVAVGDANAATTNRHVIVGSTDAARLAGHVTPTPANHKYADLGGGMDPVTDARYVNVEADAPGQWAAIARGKYDRAIRRWAHALDDTGRPRLVSFNHEPSTEAGRAGSAKDYRQAFRRFASLMAAQAPRVRMVWAVTQVSIVNGDPTVFYPGRAAVDYVSSNAFNRAGCRAKTEPWTSFGSKVNPLVELARELDQPVVISEYAMDDHPDRARWLDGVTRYVKNHPRIEALFYYNSPWNTTCDWLLHSPADYAAMTRMIAALR